MDIDNSTEDETTMELVLFILKAVVGTGLFTLILWCAQSSNPRAAGMMLTFPALNGLGLLTAESRDLHLMARAMLPMIVLNGLLCATYVVAQSQLRSRPTSLSPCVRVWTVLGACVVLWGGVALWVAPLLQSYLVSSRQIIAFIGTYAVTSVPLTALLLWSHVDEHGCGRQRFWGVIRSNAVRVGGMLGLLVLVMLLARSGAEAWAGRLSAVPLIPFYSLLMLPSTQVHTSTEVTRLEQMGGTVLLGPLVAMTFVWVFVQYLSALPLPRSTVSSLAAGVLGLLVLWSVCGLMIWGVLRGVRVLEHRRLLTNTHGLCNP
jgi:hypothetical protein